MCTEHKRSSKPPIEQKNYWSIFTFQARTPTWEDRKDWLGNISWEASSYKSTHEEPNRRRPLQEIQRELKNLMFKAKIEIHFNNR